MPRQVLAQVENSFVNGLITEATGLNFPEKACTDTDNCIFDVMGGIFRRKGIDLEDGFDPRIVNRRDTAMSSYVWKDVAKDGNITLLVVQVGSTLYFWDTNSYENISQGEIADTIDLTDHIPVGGPDPSNKECQFASGHGVLFVYHPTLEPFYVDYDPDTLTFTDTEIELKVRDFEGEEDGLETDERPQFSFAGISDKHHYNLLNQGWTDENIQVWDAARTDLPSNVDVMWLFKNLDNEFDITTVDDNSFEGNSPAINGHYIMDAFNLDRTTASSIPNLTTTTTAFRRVSTGAFFAGRVWYSGIDTPKFKGNIYFSPVIESPKEFGQCHQLNDPTAENFSALLPSDGGVITIPEAGVILKLVPVQASLIVFANNGIWAISGSQGVGLGFTANDHTITHIGDIPSISASSFVSVDGYPAWWNYDGIYALKSGEKGGLGAESITDYKISSFYQAIPSRCKLYARGAYNRLDKTVQWTYRDAEIDSIGDQYNFNRILNINILTKAFYPWSVRDADPTINGVVFIDNVGESVEVLNVVDSLGNRVVDHLGNPVVVYSRAGLIIPRYVYLVTGGRILDQITFAVQLDDTYEDWDSYFGDPVNYSSYFMTGYKLQGGAQRKFQSNYIHMFVDSSEPGEFFLQSIWDYANTADTNRWSTRQTITYTDTDYNFDVRRLKLRGQGLALQFRVVSSDNQPFGIVGWSLFETVNKTI